MVAVAGLGASAALATQARAGHIGPDVTDLDVERVGRIELHGTIAIAFSSKKPLAYVNARDDGGVVATFDISDPKKPKLLGKVKVTPPPPEDTPLPPEYTGGRPSTMEDMNLGERPDGTAFVLVRGKNEGLQIVDVTDPTKPKRRGWVQTDFHTMTCISRECYYAYSAWSSPFPVVNLNDLDAPNVETKVDSPFQGFHDWNVDGAGIMWGVGVEGLSAYDATDVIKPLRLNSSDINGMRSEYNSYTHLHGSLRPNAQDFKADGANLSPPKVGVKFGNVLLVSEEGNDHDCSDSFQTWYIPHLNKDLYEKQNPTGLPGGGSITPLDNWSLLKDTTPGVTRPLFGQWCSVHWFDFHQDGFVVMSTYDHGTHVLDVSNPYNIRQHGWHFSEGHGAMQSYWVPQRHPNGRTTGMASTLAYTADGGSGNQAVPNQEPLSGGIDIFEVDLKRDEVVE